MSGSTFNPLAIGVELISAGIAEIGFAMAFTAFPAERFRRGITQSRSA